MSSDLGRRFARNRAALVSAWVLGAICLLALAAPLIAALTGADPSTQDLGAKFAAPGTRGLLGTDDLGRDVLIRLLYGARVSLLVGLSGALASTIIGAAVGLIAGYYGGALDALLMRTTDAMLALPVLAVMIVLAAVDLDRIGLGFFYRTGLGSVIKLLLIIVFFGWMTMARLVRGAVLQLKETDFVQAAIALGVSPLRIMLAHLLPNCVGPTIVAGTLSVGHKILYESVLSFLGLGIQPPMPSWGNMLTGAQEFLHSGPHLAILPGLLILITVICVNFIGDGLRDAVDPRAQSLDS